jgi:hypothetical protein
MQHRNGWFPTRRDNIIHMADAWSEQLALHGAGWGVSADTIADFQSRLTETKALFAEVKSGNRTPVNTEQCRVLFRELTLAMQFLKANFFNMPPRTGDEFAALLLTVHDGTPTPIPPADVVPGISLHNTDGHGMLVKLFTDAAPADRRSTDHFFGKWGVKPVGRWAAPEEAASDARLLTRPPSKPEDLPMHFSTSRKRHELPFGLEDVGLEAYVTACWQTPRNQDGPYCPIISRLIA